MFVKGSRCWISYVDAQNRGLEPVIDHIYLIKENYNITDVARQEVEDDKIYETAMNNQEPDAYVKLNANASLDSEQ